MRRASIQFGTAVFGALFCAAASAQDVRTITKSLLDRRLGEKTVQLTGIDDRTVMYIDAGGQARTDLLTEYLAILPVADGPAAAHPPSVIELLDGQRLVGSLATGRTAPADSLLWEHAGLGMLAFKLDEVRRIQFQEGPAVAAQRPGEDATDIVTLANGDRIDGFVDAVGAIVSIEVNGTRRDLPAERVQEIVLGGGKPRPPVHAMVAWLSDGSVVACRSLQTSRTGEVSLTPLLGEPADKGTEAPVLPTLVMRLDDVRALAMDPAALVPLASLKVAAQAPAAGRRWSRGVEALDPRWSSLGLADIELPGPMSVEWDLPENATRFAADAELPRQMWTWGDCEIVASMVTAGGETELWRRRLNADSPRARVAVGLPTGSRRIKLRMEAGEYGAVQDKVVIRRGVVAIEGK